MKYILVACAAVTLLAGCTTYQDRDAQGRPSDEYYTEYGPYYDGTTYRTHYGRTEPTIEGLNRGVNTNYFGPVNSGAEAARGVGTPSGTFDHIRP